MIILCNYNLLSLQMESSKQPNGRTPLNGIPHQKIKENRGGNEIEFGMHKCLPTRKEALLRKRRETYQQNKAIATNVGVEHHRLLGSMNNYRMIVFQCYYVVTNRICLMVLHFF